MSNVHSAIQSLERHWQLALPEAFHRLYGAFEQPFISPCEFLPIEAMRSDEERWSGMLPQFLPFGHDGAEDFYGFYVPPFTSRSDYPVLYWDHEYDHYYPIASGFGPFLQWCVVHGRYLAQDTLDESDAEFAEEEALRHEFARLVGMPKGLITEPVARNDRELYEKLAAIDPQGTQAALQLGAMSLSRGDAERARDFFARASESTPWFADPYYLIAETYYRLGDDGSAMPRWWSVLLCPIALSTRTSNYDLGEQHPEAEIHEEAACQLACRRDRLPREMRASPLGRLILDGDPSEPRDRLALSDELARTGDAAGEERELLNALALSTELVPTGEAYERLIAFYERTHRTRDASLCRSDCRK